MRHFAIALLGIAALGGGASAGLVQPGQSISLNSSELLPASGIKLSQSDQPFTLDYGIKSPSIGFDGSLTGTLHSSVYRDNGLLTFVYDIDLNPSAVSGAAERSDFWVRSFRGFKTDVSGALDFEELIKASRTGNGGQIRLAGDTPGLGGAPMLIVRTNARDYDAKGSASFLSSDEIPLLNGSSLIGKGEATITGVFQPVALTPLPQPPAAIPLPPAVFSGLGVLLAMGLFFATRKVWAPAPQ